MFFSFLITSNNLEQNDFLTPDYLYRYTLQRMSIKRNTTTNGIPNQMISAFPFFYRVNDGFLLSLKDAKGLTVKGKQQTYIMFN